VRLIVNYKNTGENNV